MTDSYALLYLASAARLDRPGAGLRVVLLAEEQPVELQFASAGLVQGRLDYRERGTDGSRRRSQEVLQRVVTVSAQRLGGAGWSGRGGPRVPRAARGRPDLPRCQQWAASPAPGTRRQDR
ncbi:MAG: hypothetical protein AB2L07_17990 [Thermoanaerobaculaceae bacterium]